MIDAKKYQETVQLIATLAEKIGWKIAAKDIDIGSGEPGMIMGKNDYVFHVLAALDLYKEIEATEATEEEQSEECGSEGYAVFENGDNEKTEQ